MFFIKIFLIINLKNNMFINFLIKGRIGFNNTIKKMVVSNYSWVRRTKSYGY